MGDLRAHVGRYCGDKGRRRPGFRGIVLRYGLQVAVQAKVLADVNGTSGIQTEAYATSVLTTLRQGITKLETQGYTASAFVLTPADWEAVELALSSVTAIERLSLPYDPAIRRLFGVPVTTSNAQAAGLGHVIASGAVALDTNTRGVDVQWSENATADSFGKSRSAPAPVRVRGPFHLANPPRPANIRLRAPTG